METLNKKKYLLIFSHLIVVFYFLFGIQLALSQNFVNSESVICKSSNDSNKQHGLKYISHCVFDLLSDYNYNECFYIYKNIKFDKSINSNQLLSNFLKIEPKINSPPL